MIFEGDINDFEFDFTFEVKPTSCRYLYREVLSEEHCRCIERAAEYMHVGASVQAEAERWKANYSGLKDRWP